MGTRNITRVIADGEMRVSQYGQWDGYPTYTGVRVLEFVRDNDMSVFLDKVQQVNGDMIGDARFKIIAQKVCNSLGKRCVFPDDIKEAYKRGIINEREYVGYLAATRDTGCGILDLILNASIPVGVYLLEENEDAVFFIEGVYTIDLDRKIVECEYRGIRREYTFDDIRTMDIGAEMRSIEEEYYGE